MTEYATMSDINNYIIVRSRIALAMKYLELAHD